MPGVRAGARLAALPSAESRVLTVPSEGAGVYLQVHRAVPEAVLAGHGRAEGRRVPLLHPGAAPVCPLLPVAGEQGLRALVPVAGNASVAAEQPAARPVFLGSLGAGFSPGDTVLLVACGLADLSRRGRVLSGVGRGLGFLGPVPPGWRARGLLVSPPGPGTHARDAMPRHRQPRGPNVAGACLRELCPQALLAWRSVRVGLTVSCFFFA